MRRSVLIPLFAAVVAFAPSAQAAPSPQVRDAAGDWAVPSQDVQWARLSSVRVNGKPVLRGELKLAAAPTVVSAYRFGFGIGCHGYSFSYVWPGAAQAAQAGLDYTDFCRERETTEVMADKTYPVTVTVKDGLLVWETPYVGHIRKGVRVAGFHALACSGLAGVIIGGTDLPYSEIWTGDIAWSDKRYVVGSDLPRK